MSIFFYKDEEGEVDPKPFSICLGPEDEQKFLELRLEGFTMEEISYKLGESSYKLRNSIQQKVGTNEG